MNFSKKTVISTITIGLILIAIFGQRFYKSQPIKKIEQIKSEAQNQEPRVVSTNPELKENPVLLPTQTIEITFNMPLENAGEFKSRIDDFKDYKVELSNDKKTAKIIPTKPFELGKSFTIFIDQDTKFDGKKRLNQGIHFNFRTIDYHGV